VSAGAIVGDIRPFEQRQRGGDLPGALVVDRNVLEWRLAPSSDTRIVDVAPGQRVVVGCNQDYRSSLAAATLQDIGLAGATDLESGFEALMAWHRDPD
jgi:rhodanese-related sulfurtransferase